MLLALGLRERGHEPFLIGSPGSPLVEKARAEFERAQEVEERFLDDFDGVDFTIR